MMRTCATVAILVLTGPVGSFAQAKPDFSGRWALNENKSDPGTSGAGGSTTGVAFTSYLTFKQSPTEVSLEKSGPRQDSIAATYKMDGVEVAVAGPSGIAIKSKAAWDGGTLVVTSTWSYSSPAGDISTDTTEVYSLTGDSLAVEKTQTSDGISYKAKGVYDRAGS